MELDNLANAELEMLRLASVKWARKCPAFGQAVTGAIAMEICRRKGGEHAPTQMRLPVLPRKDLYKMIYSLNWSAMYLHSCYVDSIADVTLSLTRDLIDTRLAAGLSDGILSRTGA